MAARFLNADLEVYSNQPLELLRDEIGNRACTLHCGIGRVDGYLAVFEIDTDTNGNSPEFLIQSFCCLIESLGSESRALWNQASGRVVDLGFEVDEAQGDRVAFNISTATLGRMAILGMELAFTVYKADGLS